MQPGWAEESLTGYCVAQLTHGGDACGLAAVGEKLVSGGDNQHLCVWEPGQAQAVATMVGRGDCIAALPGGRFATAPYSAPTAAVWDAATGTRTCELQGHAGNVLCVAPVLNDLVATGSADKTVRLWHAATGAHTATLEGHTDWVCALAALPDGRLASGSHDRAVRLWDLSTRACTAVLKHDHMVFALAALEGGGLASGCTGNRVHLWSPASGAREAQLQGHTSLVTSLAALPRGLLASGSHDRTVRVWSVAARSCVAVLGGHSAGVWGLAALPDGRLASGCSGRDGAIRVWELRPAVLIMCKGGGFAPTSLEGLTTVADLIQRVVEERCVFPQDLAVRAAEVRLYLVPDKPAAAPAAPARALGDHGRGATLEAAGVRYGVRLLATRAWAPLQLARQGDLLEALPVAPELMLPCVAALEPAAGTWQEVAAFSHGGDAAGLAALADGEEVGGKLVSGGLNHHLRLWDPRTGQNLASWTSHAVRIAALPGERFATAPYNSPAARVWDVRSTACTCELQGHTADVNCVASLPGDLVATGSDDKAVRIWSAAGAHVATLEGHTGRVLALAALPDGRLASGSEDMTVRLWDLSTRACTAVLQHANAVFTLAILEGDCLASGCEDSKIYLWNPASGASKGLLEGHTAGLKSLAALPRGLLASGSNDKTVRVWNVAARTCETVLTHADAVWGLAALPDGRLASACDDGAIKVWELRP